MTRKSEQAKLHILCAARWWLGIAKHGLATIPPRLIPHLLSSLILVLTLAPQRIAAFS